MSRTFRGRKLPRGVYVVRSRRRGVLPAFRGRYVDHAGRRVSKTFSTIDDAAAFVEIKRAETRRIVAGIAPRPRPPQSTVAELAERILNCPPSNWGPGHAHDVRRRLKLHVLPVLGSRMVGDITRGDVLELRDRLCADKPDGKGLSVGTANRIISCLSVVLQRAVDHEMIASNPARGSGIRLTEPLIEPRTLTAAECQRFISCAELPYRALFAAAVLSGARYGELTSARWGDIYLGRARWVVRRSNEREFPKNKRQREVVLPDVLVPHLQTVVRLLYGGNAPPHDHLVFRRADRHRNRRKSKPPPLHGWCPYACPRTDRLTPGAARSAIEKAAELAEIDETPTFHSLRHSHVTIALEQGVPAPAVQRQVGHSSLEVTTRYARARASEELAGLALEPQIADLDALRAAILGGDLDAARRYFEADSGRVR